MSQQGVARSIWLSVVMMATSFILLIAAIVALIAHAVGVGETFLALMVLCGVIGFASAVRSRNRARAFVGARQGAQRAALDDGFRKPLP